MKAVYTNWNPKININVNLNPTTTTTTMALNKWMKIFIKKNQEFTGKQTNKKYQ